MKKFLLFVAIVAAGFWGADYMGYYKFPFTGEQAAQSVQRVFGRGRRNQISSDAVPVLTAAARLEDVPVTFDAVGTVQALNSVVVRAQTDGRLLELTFTDGQEVKRGDVLARIEPAAAKAQYDQAVAKKAQDEATLANARIDLERYNKLAASNFGSRQQADTQKSLVAQLEAQTRVDQALIDSAKTILDYTTIAAPIDGRTGLRAVDAGNIVHASDANGIVSIAQIRPIAAVFSLPQQQLRAVNSGIARGSMKVLALDPDNVTVVDTGKVEVIDNLVDPSTGTVKIKTTFPNDGRGLWPGQFINIRLFVDVLSQVVTVPAAAVQRGPKGPFIYVVSAENKAVMTVVTVTRQDEKIAVITSPAPPPFRVITTGFAQLTDGAAVKPAAGDEPAPVPVAAAPAEPAPAARPPGERPAGERPASERPAGERRGPPSGQQGQGRRQGEAGAGPRGAGQAAAQPPAGPAPPATAQ